MSGLPIQIGRGYHSYSHPDRAGNSRSFVKKQTARYRRRLARRDPENPLPKSRYRYFW